MQLGGADDWFGGWQGLDEAVTEKVAALGFRGLGLHFPGDPLDEELAVAQRKLRLLEACRIDLVQFWGAYPPLISRDESVRQEALRICRNIIRRAAELGAHMASLRPTSFHPDYAWGAQPDNYLPETGERLTRGLAELGETAAAHGIPVALECHLTTVLDSPARVRRIIERSNPDWIRVNADVVNFIPDFQTAWDTRPLIDEVFDELGPYIASAHLKDVIVEPRLVVHIAETVPGRGHFAWDHFLRRFEAQLPQGFALIEHLSAYDQVREARDFVAGRLAELGIAAG